MKRKKPKASGKIGSKRSDLRFQAPDGSIWDSKFEWHVWEGAKNADVRLHRADKAGKTDTLSYVHNIRNARCQDCGSDRVGSVRGITFDMVMRDWHPVGKENGGYLECKGYMRANKRALYRSFFKEKPGFSAAIIIQSNYKVGKGTFGDWISKILKIPYFHWQGVFPKPSDWVMPVIKQEKSKSTRNKRKR